MNTKLLRRIAKHISEEPARLVMGTFVEKQQSPAHLVREWSHQGGPSEHPFAQCGTAACIAGWAVLLSHGMTTDFHPGTATKLLGLAGDWSDEDTQGSRLFEVKNWPKQFRHRYRRAKRLRTRANVAVARIEHFIATKGEE